MVVGAGSSSTGYGFLYSGLLGFFRGSPPPIVAGFILAASSAIERRGGETGPCYFAGGLLIGAGAGAGTVLIGSVFFAGGASKSSSDSTLTGLLKPTGSGFEGGAGAGVAF